MPPQILALAAVTLLASLVNGALGYGFSSITVPLALMFLTNRAINPALVLIEVPLNAYVLFVNRASIPLVWRRVVPIMIGLSPGIAVGTLVIATDSPVWVRFWTFVVLLPLILVQAAGYRRPIRAERRFGAAFGAALGVLYSLTTISGPPLALLLSNQGFAKREFRAALGLVRLTESTLTALAYGYAAIYTRQSASLVLFIVPSVMVGVPLGALAIRRIEPETFRRLCMSFDAWIVAFGLSRALQDVGLVDRPAAYAMVVAVSIINLYLL